jgi:hypothetical protein
MQKKNQTVAKQNLTKGKRLWLASGLVVLVALVLVGAWQMRTQAATREAPEAAAILAAQAATPFQILIPAYMPREVIRDKVGISMTETGPGGEPMVQLVYRTKSDDTIFLKQWVPVNPEKEILAGSRPVQTIWGQGYMIAQGESLAAIWVDVGPTRVSIYTPTQKHVTREEILQMANTLGPASSSQVFDFVLELPQVLAVEPAPPFAPPVNADGVQEFTLVVTPGGYDPLRIQLKQGVPVKMTFRAIGQVGCGKELLFRVSASEVIEGRLETEADQQVIEFTPTQAGTFEFHCSHQMYRGMLTVAP